MKILVTYFSTTGNTEKVAKAIKEGIEDHDVDLLSAKELDPNHLINYDLVFMGSGIFAFNVSRKLVKLVNKAPELPPRFAYFYTHESTTPWPKAFKSINDIVEKKGCQVLGEFECCGENLVPLAEQQREAARSKLSPEERKEHEEKFLKLVKGHPNEEDLEKARNFATSIIEKL